MKPYLHVVPPTLVQMMFLNFKIEPIIINFLTMKHFRVLMMGALIYTTNCSAQESAKDIIEGTWKGTSLCQVKNSPCHDEIAVYHISKGTHDKTYIIRGNKVVNGVEEEMGILDALYDDTKHTLTINTKDKQGRGSLWLFKIEGKQMHGTLTTDEKVLFRVIE